MKKEDFNLLTESLEQALIHRRVQAAKELEELRDKVKIEQGGIYSLMTKKQQRTEDALDLAINTLTELGSNTTQFGAEPDERGLMPCGCGQPAECVIKHETTFEGKKIVKYAVKCPKNHVHTNLFDTQLQAKNYWQRAMGGSIE